MTVADEPVDPAFLIEAQKVVDEIGMPLVGEGGSVVVKGRSGPALLVAFEGGCHFCPNSMRLVLLGIEEELSRRLPGIEYLEPVMD